MVNVDYPSIVADYERSFPVLRALPCDVFVGPHPDFFSMVEKRERMTRGASNPFVDPDELRRYVDRSERQFRDILAREQAAAAPSPKSPPAQTSPPPAAKSPPASAPAKGAPSS